MQKRLKTNRLFLFYGLLLGVVCVSIFIKTLPARASTGINQTINFQGRLLNAQGATVADGFYNIQFKIYQDGDGQSVGNTTGSPSGSLKWTESHLNNNTQGVKVVNGYLSVQLGSVTAFGSNIDWNQDTLWLSMNVGGTGAACTPFSSCSPDGEMVPMQPLTSAPYALNSGMLGGIASSGFVQLAQGLQTDASSVDSIAINKTGGSGNILNLQASSTSVFTVGNSGDVLSKHTSVTAFQVQNAAGTNFLAIDTSGNIVNIGVTGSVNANSTIHIADSSAGVQTVTIGSTNSTSTTTIQAGSGGVTLSGNTTVSGANTFTTGTGAVALNGDTTIASGKSLTANGTALFKTNSATAFQVQNAAGTSNLLVADTTNTRIGIGASPATSLLTIGTNTTAASGGVTFGTDTNLYRSGSGELSTTGNLIVSSLQANSAVYASAGFSIFDASANAGTITKDFVVGTGGISDGDVVVMTSTPDIRTTTTARDSRVYGVSKSTASATATARIAISGHYTVNVDTGAVAIGDQLVTSTTAGKATVDNNATTGIIGIALSSKAGGSSGTVSIYIHPVNGQYSPTFRNASDNTTAFQVQNAAGTNFLAIDTSGNIVNIGVTGSVNANSTIHIADSSAGVQTVTIGSTNSTSTTTIQAGSGGVTLSGNTTISGANTFTTGTGAVALNGDTTIASGKNFTQSGGGTFSTGTGANSLNGDTTVASGKTFTANGTAVFKNNTDSVTAFQVQNAVGSAQMLFDNTGDPTNLITNGNFEASTTGWAALTSASLSTTASQKLYNASSLDILTGTTTGSGAKYNVTLANSSTYTFTIRIRTDVSTSSLAMGYSSDGTSGGETNCSSSLNVSTTAWKVFSCTISTPGSHSGTPYVYIKQASTVNRHYYVDGVKLEAGSNSTPFYESRLALTSLINTPVTIQPTTDLQAFSVLATDGTYQLNVDNGNSVVGIGSAGSSTAKLMVSTSSKTVLRLNQTGSSNLLELQNNGTNVASVTSTGATVLTNSADSAAAFQIQKSTASDNLFTADTTSNKIVIGNATGTDANTTLFVIDSATADPTTGYNGAQYYNSSTNKFRCYQNSAWVDCITTASGVTTIGTYSSSNHYNDGASISGTTLTLGSADATHPGLVDTGSQTFAGDKIFKAASFQIQSTGAQSLLIADTSAQKVAIGPAAAAANSVLTIGTSTTAASGGITFGADTSATLYRSNSAELTTGSTLIVAGLQSGADVSFTSSAANVGAITKSFTTGSSVSLFDVVVMTNAPDVQTTTIARDNTVFGVSKSTVSSGTAAKIVTSGNYTVSVDVGAVAIGDQLVTSTNAGKATVDNNATTGILGTALSSKSAGANGTVSVYVRPVGGQYTPTFRGANSSTTAFQVQSSGGNNFLAVDTSGNIVNVGITGSTNANSTVNIATSSAATQIVNIGSTGNTNNAVTINSGATGGISLNGNTSVGGSSTFSTGTGLVSLNGDTTMASGKNFTQNGAGTFSTGTGPNSLNGATTVTGTNTFTVSGGLTSLGANLDVTGSAALKKGTDFSTTGTTNNASFANASLIRLTGGSAQTITGIQNGRDGYILNLVNAGVADATIKNEDTNSTAANRITTGSGGDILLPVGASATLVYDSSGQRWRANPTTSLQSAYNNSSSPQITVDSSHGGVVVQDASSAIGAALFTVQTNGGATKYLNVDATTVAISDNLTVTGTYNTNTFTSTALQFGGASGTVSTSSGNLTIQAASTNSLLLDTAGAGTVSLGNSNAATVNVGGSATTLNVGTGNVAKNIHIGDGGTSTNQTITIGSNGIAASSVTIYGGASGGVHLNGPTVVDGVNTFTTGTGAVALNGDTTVASGKNFTQSGAGTFTTGSGANTLSGDTTISGSHTFATGTGTVGLNGDTTIASGKSLTANGTALFKTSSATAFRVQNSSSRNLLAIDTTTNIVSVGNDTDGANITLNATGNSSSAIRKPMDVTGAVSANDLVQVDTANDGKVKQAIANSSLVFGVATGAASSAIVDIVISGVYQVNADAVVLVPGDLLVSSSTAGKVTKAGSTVASGTVLGRALSTKGAGAGLVWVTLTLGVGGSDSLQTAYNNSTGGSTPEVKVDSTRGGVDIQDADSTIGGSLLTVRGSNGGGAGTAIFDVQSTGAISLGYSTQTATITVGQSTASNTINVGAVAGNGNTQTINIGTSATAGSTTNIAIGSTIAGTTTINGATGVSITGNTTISGANTFTTGTGAVALNGDTTIASGKNFTQSGGGTFTTGSGANTLSGDTTVSGAHTFTTGTGAVALNGNATVASGKSFTANGDALFKDSSSSATAFQVQNTSSRSILTVDTSGNILSVGNNTDGGNITLNATGNASAAIRKSMVVTGTIAANDLVEIDTSNAGQVQQAVASSTRIFGIATSAVGSGSAQDIVMSGVYQVNANTSGGTPAIGDVLVSSTTAGQVTKTGTTTASGSVVGLALSTISSGKIWVYVNLGLGGSDNLQTVYNKSTGSTTPEIKVDSTRGGVDIQDADSTISGSLLTVRASNGAGAGAALFDVQSTGAINMGSTTQTATITVGQSTDTNTISIGNAATASGKTQTVNIGANGAAGSTTNTTIGSTVAGTTTINGATGISLTGVTTVSNGKTLVLGSNNGTGGLTCTNGAIFYDSGANRFKGCESSAWVTLDNYADLQTYTADGSWTKLANVTTVQVIMVGGGGGAGGGAARNGGQERNGGGGGGGGAYASQVYSAADLASGSVVVGTAGTAGTGAPSSATAGGNGGAGGTSCFASGAACSGTVYLKAFGGGGGAGGNQGNPPAANGGGGGGAGSIAAGGSATTNTGGTGGAPNGAAANTNATSTAGAGGGTGPTGGAGGGNSGGNAEYGGGGGGATASGANASGSGGSSVFSAGGGGAGGSVNSGNSSGTSGAGGSSRSYSYSAGGGGAAGSSTGCTGGGNGGTGNSIKPGAGGGGGGAGGNNPGCAGGNGGQPGGGAGGGGAGSTSGGAGGSGGAGEVWVISW